MCVLFEGIRISLHVIPIVSTTKIHILHPFNALCDVRLDNSFARGGFLISAGCLSLRDYARGKDGGREEEMGGARNGVFPRCLISKPHK